tara:strand:+ start:34 stop:357 length:324 start_codon:yes stop_codon:yes gene_type:complete
MTEEKRIDIEAYARQFISADRIDETEHGVTELRISGLAVLNEVKRCYRLIDDLLAKGVRLINASERREKRLRSELRDAESLIQTALDHETDEDFRRMYEDFLEEVEA